MKRTRILGIAALCLACLALAGCVKPRKLTGENDIYRLEFLEMAENLEKITAADMTVSVEVSVQGYSTSMHIQAAMDYALRKGVMEIRSDYETMTQYIVGGAAYTYTQNGYLINTDYNVSWESVSGGDLDFNALEYTVTKTEQNGEKIYNLNVKRTSFDSVWDAVGSADYGGYTLESCSFRFTFGRNNQPQYIHITMTASDLLMVISVSYNAFDNNVSVYIPDRVGEHYLY